MKLAPKELDENGYVLLDQFKHQDAISFIRKYSKKRNSYMIAYWFCNTAIAIAMVALYGYQIHTNRISFSRAFSSTCLGLALVLPLIPLHEWIHGLTYQFMGASQTSYHMNLKKFYFYAIADHFVVDRREFRKVALAPFVVISLLLLWFILMAANQWVFTFLGTLLMHTACCSGDFALLSYFREHADYDVLTYDDKANGIAYFYGRKR